LLRVDDNADADEAKMYSEKKTRHKSAESPGQSSICKWDMNLLVPSKFWHKPSSI
jgi:hypothetical protein